jgi:hypothetical protein
MARSTGTERNGIVHMATVSKPRPTTAGAAKTITKPLGAKASTGTTPAAKASVPAKGSPTAVKGTKATPQSATGAAPRPAMGRFMLGMVAYLIGSYVIQYLIIFLDVKFKWGLEKKTLVTLPLLGPINGITLIFMLSLVGLLFALYKFRVLPSATSMRQAGANAATASRANATASKGGTTAPKSPTAAKGNLPKPAASKVRVEPKNATVGKPTAGKTTTATAGGNAKATAKKAAPEPVVTDDDAGENDELYQQVRAQIRSQARKRKR